MSKASLVILISGNGSNLQAIIDAIKSGQLDAEIKAVISNKADAKGLKHASRENIKTYVIDHTQYNSRELFDQEMIKHIDPLKPVLIVLAGFMRILSTQFINHYRHRLINIHPSLLPKHKGLNTHQRVIENKETKHGASVHYVSAELDSGPIVIQAEVPVLTSDTIDTLASRVLEEEHKIYPQAIQLHCDKRLSFDKQKSDPDQLYFDNKKLTGPLIWKDNKLLLD